MDQQTTISGIEEQKRRGIRFMISTAKSEKVIWSIVVLLVMVSVLAVYSATGSLAYKERAGQTSYYLVRQLLFTLSGIGIIYFTHLIHYKWFSRLALWLYIISIPMLLFTLVFGTNLNDASRWITLPVLNLSFQTSDFARLALFMYLARQLSRKQDDMDDFKEGYLPLVSPIAITCILIAPANLSTALLTGLTGMLILFMGRAKMKFIALTTAVALIPVVILIIAASIWGGGETKIANNGEVVESIRSTGRVGTWVNRVHHFLYASETDLPYQVQQANIAIAKGRWIGLGPGNSEQRNFLPHSYSDFIYAIIIEEYGFIGGILLLGLYIVFLYRCIRLQRRFPYAFGTFLAMALSINLVIQALVNMGVNVGLLPVTGVTLPLVSMGGTSIIFTCLSIGIILSVARNLEAGGDTSADNAIDDDEAYADEEEVANG